MKSTSNNDTIDYKKQHNMAVKLNKRFKKEIFDNPETKSNSKPFWSTYGPYFSNKHAKGDADILLPENGNILLDNRTVADVFSNYFRSITKNLDLFEWQDEPQFNISDETDIAVNKFRPHHSIIELKQKFSI